MICEYRNVDVGFDRWVVRGLAEVRPVKLLPFRANRKKEYRASFTCLLAFLLCFLIMDGACPAHSVKQSVDQRWTAGCSAEGMSIIRLES